MMLQACISRGFQGKQLIFEKIKNLEQSFVKMYSVCVNERTAFHFGERSKSHHGD